MTKRYFAFAALVLVLGAPYAIDPVWELFHPRTSVASATATAIPTAPGNAPSNENPGLILQSAHEPVNPDFDPIEDKEGAAAFAPPPPSAKISETPAPGGAEGVRIVPKTEGSPSPEETAESRSAQDAPLFTPDEIASYHARRHRPEMPEEDPATAPELRNPRHSRPGYRSFTSNPETNSFMLGSPALNKSESAPGTYQVLSYRNDTQASRIAEERIASTEEPSPEAQAKTSRTPLGEKSFVVTRFTPGLSESGKAIPVRKSIDLALEGPDYAVFEEANTATTQERSLEKAQKKSQARVLPFGRGGELIVEIADQGELMDEPGPDFVVYAKIHGPFAKVAVSESLEEESFHWFDCEPEKNILIGCAGVVPTAQEGDKFDLRTIGVKSARYIKIKDWGKNQPAGTDPAWFELDSLSFIHAYKPQP